MRMLGDAYVKDEFVRHKNAETTAEQWKEFVSEWRKYVATLKGEGGITSGELDQEVLENMNKDQQMQLLRIREEATRIGRDN